MKKHLRIELYIADVLELAFEKEIDDIRAKDIDLYSRQGRVKFNWGIASARPERDKKDESRRNSE